MNAAVPLSEAARSAWGKTDRKGTSALGWLPLWRHLADSADVAGRLWDHWLSPAVRLLIAGQLPDGEADGRRLAVWLAGIHDVGKATPAFTMQATFRPETAWLTHRMRDHGLVYNEEEVKTERARARHEYAGHVILADWLQDQHDWTDPRTYAVVVGGHHGSPPTDDILNGIVCRPYLRGDEAWAAVQRELLTWMTDRADVASRLGAWADSPLTQPAQAALTGLVIVADWIASNEEFFPYTLDQSDHDRLDFGWDTVDLPPPWIPAAPPPPADLFASRFTLPPGARPRPVQLTAAELASTMPTPGMMIIEAPMGEGKTEAALACVEILARRTNASGCFIALPTRATSDAMFARVLDWLRRLPDASLGRGIRDVRLAHGKAAFNADYDTLRRHTLPSGIAQDEGGTAIGVHTWLAGGKRSLLSGFVIGTVDQLLLAALRSKHLALRHLGLAGKVVVIDEAHAYDVYMGQFLDRALEWLAGYGVPVIVLSATLPAGRRAELMEAYDRGRLGTPPPLTWRDRRNPRTDHYADLRGDTRYPLLTVSTVERGGNTTACSDSGRSIAVRLTRLDDDTPALVDLLTEQLSDGGCALVIRNTVARVQDTALALRQALGDDIPVSVAHSRFMAVDRADKDRWLRKTFGPPGSAKRPSRHIVVASQVAEQSLDIDFDLLVTDLAPVDLILQRIGRLHRHHRTDRPTKLTTPTCWITGADWAQEPPLPATGSRRVYHHSALLRSAGVLHPHLVDGLPLHIPSDIAPLTQTAYGNAQVGPDAWQPAMEEEARKQQDALTAKELKAKGFRLAEVAERGVPLIGWLSGGIGAADDHIAQGHVRDTDSENLEVLLLVRTPDGLVTPPWISGGGRLVPIDAMPSMRLGKEIARCTLPLPRSMTDPEVIDHVVAELEARSGFPAWQDNPWLAGEVVLEVDLDGRAHLAAFDLHYDAREGLRVDRSQTAANPP